MTNIIKSLLLVVAIAAVAGGATYSYFSDTAEVKGNTFAAGTLNIEAANCTHHERGWFDNKYFNHDWDDCHGSTKFEIKNAQPGNCATDKFAIKNTGTLTARDFTADATMGSDPLCAALVVTPESLTGVTVKPGASKDISVKVCFTDDNTDQSALQGHTCTFTMNAHAKAYDSTGGAPEPLFH